MRVVLPGGSLPASLKPRSIDRAGIAMTSMTASPATTAGHGWRPTKRAQRAHIPSSAAGRARRRDGRPTRLPTYASNAGSIVRLASMVSSTASADATASPSRKLRPSTTMPSSAMITVVPANSTARPAVSIATIVAGATSAPDRRLSRKRVTMKRA